MEVMYVCIEYLAYEANLKIKKYLLIFKYSVNDIKIKSDNFSLYNTGYIVWQIAQLC